MGSSFMVPHQLAVNQRKEQDAVRDESPHPQQILIITTTGISGVCGKVCLATGISKYFCALHLLYSVYPIRHQ